MRLFCILPATRTLTKNLDPQSNRTETIFDFGCFTVDHFDAKGANVVIDFWEKYLLSDDIKQLLRDVGHVGKDPGIVGSNQLTS
jgi:hypothetical protein